MKPMAVMYSPTSATALAAGWVRTPVTVFGKMPVRMHSTARMPMARRMPKGTSLTFSYSLGSCPKKTDWLTLTKEASVSVEVTRAMTVTARKPMLLDSTAFW